MFSLEKIRKDKESEKQSEASLLELGVCSLPQASQEVVGADHVCFSVTYQHYIDLNSNIMEEHLKSDAEAETKVTVPG
jgi:hypothetical protein